MDVKATKTPCWIGVCFAFILAILLFAGPEFEALKVSARLVGGMLAMYILYQNRDRVTPRLVIIIFILLAVTATMSYVVQDYLPARSEFFR